MAIYFYSEKGDYGALSNYARYGVKLDGESWPTVEHYFQAQKFDDARHRARIRRAATAKEAKTLGRSRKVPLRPDWEDVKDDIMYRAVKKKFKTHKAARKLLLGTGDEDLIENAPMDSYWGCGDDGKGLNRLGAILMQVRDELRS